MQDDEIDSVGSDGVVASQDASSNVVVQRVSGRDRKAKQFRDRMRHERLCGCIFVAGWSGHEHGRGGVRGCVVVAVSSKERMRLKRGKRARGR